jgi:hypothetical protein
VNLLNQVTRRQSTIPPIFANVSFLYPLFLLAGLSIGIPVLIHLFNLRRYKTVYFPHTRFLKNIQLRSQKQSQVRYKWLLAMRILFLLSLVLAFAQPFFQNSKKDADINGLQVLYIDNSASMSIKKGARTLLEIAKENAGKQLRQAAPGNKFLLLTNDRPVSYQPLSAEMSIAALSHIDFSSSSKNASQLLNTVQGIMQAEAFPHADLYYYSDFQKNTFPGAPDNKELAGIDFHGMPIRSDVMANVFIDTVLLTSPVLQPGADNQVVVISKFTGNAPKETPVLQLMINGQVKSAASLHFNERYESTDTLSFQVNDAGWQQISLVINDAVRFDDTFRIAAKSNSNMAVLVLNENQTNPFLQAAFRAYQGLKMDNRQLHETVDWKQYNLIILNGITQLNESLAKQLAGALQQGQSVAVFPGKTTNFSAINTELSKVVPLQLTGIDTASQLTTNLQQGSDLVKDIFDRIPDNVQLPQVNWHYRVHAGLSANQQAVISFRNGDPLLAQYSPSRGKLYLLTTAADIQAGNFPTSYFFAPFLYQMTTQSQTGNVFAAAAGTEHPIFISLPHTGERNMVHAYNNGDLDVIPPQRVNGAGLDIFAGKVLTQAGFYQLVAPGNDTIHIALNEDRKESQLELWDLAKLRDEWKGKGISWSQTNETVSDGSDKGSSFPLWKLCVAFALLLLAVETYLLTAHSAKQLQVK